jgi:hypothetical protein
MVFRQTSRQPCREIHVSSRLLIAAAGLLAVVALPAAQSDLDALMSRVLSRRDQSWKQLQQYTLGEQETLRVTAPGGIPIYGFDRQYLWFPRAGFFIRSPVRADGVALGDDERRRAEDRWLAQQQIREKRRAARSSEPDTGPQPDASPDAIQDVISQSFEPQFVSSANFLRFRFDPGQYAFVGRERLMNRDVLRIEYYPTKLFAEGRARPNRELRKDDARIQNRMNKVSLITLWVDPALEQILQYDFHNIDMDFLPARSLVRLDELEAWMRMSEAFPGVWLPASITIGFQMTLAIGEVAARYEVTYDDYRLAATAAKVLP